MDKTPGIRPRPGPQTHARRHLALRVSGRADGHRGFVAVSPPRHPRPAAITAGLDGGERVFLVVIPPGLDACVSGVRPRPVARPADAGAGGASGAPAPADPRDCAEIPARPGASRVHHGLAGVLRGCRRGCVYWSGWWYRCSPGMFCRPGRGCSSSGLPRASIRSGRFILRSCIAVWRRQKRPVRVRRGRCQQSCVSRGQVLFLQSGTGRATPSYTWSATTRRPSIGYPQ